MAAAEAGPSAELAVAPGCLPYNSPVSILPEVRTSRDGPAPEQKVTKLEGQTDLVKFAAICDVGDKKAPINIYGTREVHNQDGILFVSHLNPTTGERRDFMLILDGMGGEGGGEVAAKAFGEAFGKAISAGKDAIEAVNLSAEAIVEAAKTYAAQRLRGAFSMGTAFAVAEFKQDDGKLMFRTIHCGNCRFTQVEGSSVVFNTADHEFDWEFCQKQENFEAEAQGIRANRDFSGALSRYAGLKGGQLEHDKFRPEVSDWRELKPGQKLLGTTDGVTDNWERKTCAKMAKRHNDPGESVTYMRNELEPELKIENRIGNDNVVVAEVQAVRPEKRGWFSS